jgi:hypothetical protein
MTPLPRLKLRGTDSSYLETYKDIHEIVELMRKEGKDIAFHSQYSVSAERYNTLDNHNDGESKAIFGFIGTSLNALILQISWL